VAPTEVGLAFYERCVRVLEDVDEAMNLAGELSDRPTGKLRMNGPMSFGTLHLAKVVSDYARSYPEVRVERVRYDRRVDPIAEGFDLTVRIARPEALTSLVTHEINRSPLVLCAAPGYLDRHGEPRSPKDLATARCLHYGYQETGNQWRLRGPEGEMSWPVNCTMWSNNGEVLKQAALGGLGICLLPDFIVGDALREGTLRCVLPEHVPEPLSLLAVYPRHRHLSAKVRRMVELMEERFGGDNCWDR
jgi:DNA-binding transcriptional LysR family regulator